MKNEIKHYGVLGMRWGRRRGKKSSRERDNQSKKTDNDSASKRREEKIKKLNRIEKGGKIGIGVGAALVVGSMAAQKILDNRANAKIGSIQLDKGTQYVQGYLLK